MSEGFVPGLDLSGVLHDEGVAPLLARHHPTLVYSAARLGPGSEVLGFATERSTDHDWGARLQVFLTAHDLHSHGPAVRGLLSDGLPGAVLGHPTGPVEVTDVGSWFTRTLGFDPRSPVTTFDWLAVPCQLLATATAGAVFHDGLGELGAARAALAWYPADLWRHVLACQWQRIAEEESFVGRCGEVGDELGASVVAGRLARDLMRLRLLQERRYPPYAKWLGSAFARLPDAPQLGDRLRRALRAGGRDDREDALAAAFEHVARAQNRLDLAAVVDPATRPYHDRPYRVLHAERFTAALHASIGDRTIAGLPLVGTVDQWIDNTAALTRPAELRAATRAMLAAHGADEAALL